MDLKKAFFLTVVTFGIVAITLCITIMGSSINDNTQETPAFNTPHGRYVGIVKTYPDGFQITKYLGIPFAQPPLGNLRFKRPLPLTKGNPDKVIRADKFKKSCISVTKESTNTRYGEDCLYLNIYIPGNQSECQEKNETRSVMIWLHGGAFVAGSAFPEPVKLAIRGNVIIVMVNYRLGVLGFLTTNDEALPGNNGLWDQVMAIRWVKENIRFFGGHENKLTVFGESAGSISTHLLTLSPVSTDLFQKIILQSGTASTLLSKDYLQYAQRFGQMVGCNNFFNHTEFAKCLRGITVSDILQYDKPENFNLTLARRQIDFIWMPIVDGILIPDHPDTLLKNKSYLQNIGAFKKDYIVGVLDNEGGIIPENFLYHLPLSSLQNDTFYRDLTDYFFYIKYGLRPNQTVSLRKAVNEFYFGSIKLTSPLAQQTVLDTASDALFVGPAVETALAVSMCNKNAPPLCQTPQSNISSLDSICTNATAKVFFYYFDYCPLRDPCQVPCMSHGSDIAYEFPKTNSPEFNQMSDLFIDILTTFAKSSDPGSVLQSGWQMFEPNSQHYLRLSPKPTVRQYLNPYRTNLWLKTVPKMVESIIERKI